VRVWQSALQTKASRLALPWWRTFRDIKKTLCVFLEDINSTRIFKAAPPFLSINLLTISYSSSCNSSHHASTSAQEHARSTCHYSSTSVFIRNASNAHKRVCTHLKSRCTATPTAKTSINGLRIPSLIATIRDFLKDKNAYVCSCI
jgi:hypothetical protein